MPTYDINSPIKAKGKLHKSGSIDLPEAIGAGLVASGHLSVPGDEPVATKAPAKSAPTAKAAAKKATTKAKGRK